MTTKQESKVEMKTIKQFIEQVQDWLILCQQQLTELNSQIIQNPENSDMQTSIFKTEGRISGYSFCLFLLKSIKRGIDLPLALESVDRYLDDIIYIEFADLIDGPVNQLEVKDPKYFYTLAGEYYAYAKVSDLIVNELKRISQTEMASETADQVVSPAGDPS
jgi:hypothetical protein